MGKGLTSWQGNIILISFYFFLLKLLFLNFLFCWFRFCWFRCCSVDGIEGINLILHVTLLSLQSFWIHTVLSCSASSFILYVVIINMTWHYLTCQTGFSRQLIWNLNLFKGLCGSTKRSCILLDFIFIISSNCHTSAQVLAKQEIELLTAQAWLSQNSEVEKKVWTLSNFNYLPGLQACIHELWMHDSRCLYLKIVWQLWSSS